MVQKGLRWQVGNGRSIRIWMDKGLPTPSSFKVISPLSHLHEDARVEELIEASNRTWKQDVLKQVFLPHKAESINRMALSSNPQDDKQIWAPISTGLFSVRSAYWVAMEVSKGCTVGVSNDSDLRKFWKYLWNMNILHKVRHIAWRACKDILPTKENLKRRKVLMDSSCELCQAEAKTSGNRFWSFSNAQEVWWTSKLFF